MKCQVPDRNNPYDRTCQRDAEWIIQVSTLGYPVNEAVPQKQIRVCGMHMLVEAAAVAGDYRKVLAGFQAVRIEQAESYQEVKRLRGGA